MSLHFPFEHAPAPGLTLPVASGVHWLRMPLPFALDHINLWLLADGQGWTIIDTGIGSEVTREHWQAVFQSTLQGRPVRRVIVTHFHPDHIGSAAWLAREWGVEVWMTQGEFLTAQAIAAQLPGFDVDAMVRQFAQHGLDAAHQASFRARGNAYSKVAPELPRQFRRILPQDDISIGGHSWRVMPGFGHSPEHAALYCAGLGVLISGDMLLPRISTNVSVPAACPEADVLRWYLDSIAAFKTLPPDTLVLPSHGRPFIGAHTRVDELHAHHAARCAEIVAACTEPRTAFELLPLLFKRDLDTHQLMFAMGEAIAHLNFLHHDGRVLRVSDDDGIMRYTTRPGTP
ncbi:MAG: hypothetical protein RIR70_113 [Pseudomonadota bacterium]